VLGGQLQVVAQRAAGHAALAAAKDEAAGVQLGDGGVCDDALGVAVDDGAHLGEQVGQRVREAAASVVGH